MNHAFFPIRLRGLAMVASLVVALGIGGLAAASTPTPDDHASHHGGVATPTPATACATGTPRASMPSGMMMGTLRGSMGGMMMGTPGTSMPGGTMAEAFDLMFIDMMIPHHEGAIVMARIAMDRAEHQEVRDLAQSIITSQQAEIDQMKAWRDAWYPGVPAMPMEQMTGLMGGMMAGMPGPMGTPIAGMGGMMGGNGMMGMMEPQAEAQVLCDATGPFDRAFLEAMIPHHQMAVQMGLVALQQATHPELKALAQAIIDAQTREIEQMNGWLASWYGATPAAAAASDGDVATVNVALSEFRVEASVTAFAARTPYRFAVTNKGMVNHEFMVMPRMAGMGRMDMETLDAMSLGMIPAEELPPGASGTLEVTFPEPGTYELVCAVPGHYDAGMTLTVTVS